MEATRVERRSRDFHHGSSALASGPDRTRYLVESDRRRCGRALNRWWQPGGRRSRLVDFARSKHSQKRGAGGRKVSLDEALLVVDPGRNLVAIGDALRALADVDERKGQVVQMRFFGGLSVEETAEAARLSGDGDARLEGREGVALA